MRHKKRIIVILTILLLISVLGLFIEVTRYNGHRICGYCSSTQDYEMTSYYVMGQSWENVNEGDFYSSHFLIDYPDHQCKHTWAHYDGLVVFVWNSPLLLSVMPDYTEFYVSRSVLVEGYVTSQEFRQDLNGLLSDGKLSRGRLLEVANLNCMDGGKCVLDREVDEDAFLLDIINKYEGELKK